MTDPYETFVRWYLRFNGYFSVENFVIHEPVNGVIPQGGEIDILAVRFPYQLETPGFQIHNDERIIDEEAAANKFTDIIIAEVKGGKRQNLNDIWIKPDPDDIYSHRLEYLISWIGIFPDEGAISHVVEELRTKYRSQVGLNLFRLILFNHNKSKKFEELGIQQVTFEEIADFFVTVRSPSWQGRGLGVRSAHDQWDPLIKEIWKIGDPENKVEDEVKIHKVLGLLANEAKKIKQAN